MPLRELSEGPVVEGVEGAEVAKLVRIMGRNGLRTRPRKSNAVVQIHRIRQPAGFYLRQRQGEGDKLLGATTACV